MRKGNFFRYGLSGAAAGIVNGLFGSGGGMVLIPMLSKFGKVDGKEVFSTSLCVVFPMCLISILVHSMNHALPLKIGLPYFVGGIAGGIIGALVFRKVKAIFLHRLFGILILWGGLRLLR